MLYTISPITLLLSVTLNTLFLYKTTHWSLAILWAVGEVVVFILPRKGTLAALKIMVQVVSFALTFLFILGYVQQSAANLQQSDRDIISLQRKVDTIDARLDQIKNGYESIDPVYIEKKNTLLANISRHKNTSYKYMGKVRPESFWEVTNGCNPNGPISRKVSKVYASTCVMIQRYQAQLDVLSAQYNSASSQDIERRNLVAQRDRIMEDWPKFSQNNLKGLTDTLAQSFGIAASGDKLLIVLVFLICGVVTWVNTHLSLTHTLKPRFRQDGNRTVTGQDSGQDTGLKIPGDLNVNTDEGSRFMEVLQLTMENQCEGCVINKPTIQGYAKCSSDIAQAVIKTLAHNGLLEKDGKVWIWVRV